ncbi:MAG: DUF115 domain-containing protein [Campylobacterales bacterium]|nr:DUF115 domain-containing protein [Campylobacterales bacterium]
MQNIEEQALQTYNENILFLQINHPSVFHKLTALENAISNGYHQERYSLEYKNGYFDVMDIESKKWFYDTDSTEHAKEIAKLINYNKKDNVYETYLHFDIDDENIAMHEETSTEESPLSASAHLLHYSNKYANDKNTSMKKIYKFIFIGTGLGLHIQAVHQRLQSSAYFIVEDDLELFKLSLFVTNYGKIHADGSEIIFSIFDDANEFQQNTQKFLETLFIYNHYIKFLNLSVNDEKKLKAIQEIIVSQGYLAFNFAAMTKSFLRPLDYLKCGYPILNLNSLPNKQLIKNKPVLLLGAGPSLGRNIDWVKKNQDKFIIISISTILYELEKHNIKPDIITHIHGDYQALPHIQKVRDVSFFDKSVSIFASMAFMEFTEYFKKENVFIFENNSSYKNDFGNLVTENVGSSSYKLLLQLQVEEFYMLGIDFALDQETGATHIESHEHLKTAKLEEDEDLGGALDYEMAVVKVPGNFLDEVYSTILYRNQTFELTKVYQAFGTMHTKKIYNLSNGAYIENTLPLKVEDIDYSKFEVIDKDLFYDALKSLLRENSENFLTASELHKIKIDIQECDMKIDILNEFKKKNHQDLNSYHGNILRMFQACFTSQKGVENQDLSHILTLYFQFTSGYIFDIINTKEIKNPKKLMKDLNKLFIPQLTKIITHYKERLQKYIDFANSNKSVQG